MTTIDEAAKAADWYQKMAVAMRERDKCLAAIERWRGKLAEAEEHIKALAGQVQGDEEQQAAIAAVAEEGPAPADADQGLDPSYADSAE